MVVAVVVAVVVGVGEWWGGCDARDGRRKSLIGGDTGGADADW